MYTIWLFIGTVMILMGIFNQQLLRLLGLKPKSEGITTPNLKRSARLTERIGRWLVILLGASFLVQGLGNVLPGEMSNAISSWLLGLAGLMLVAIIGITLANWKAR